MSAAARLGGRRGNRFCNRSNSSRDVCHGSASNHPCSSVVTAANGSGRRRNRLGFAFPKLVGRTSPSFHAVRSPERNCSNVGEEGFAVSPKTGRSAIVTSCCWIADLFQQTNWVQRGAQLVHAASHLCVRPRVRQPLTGCRRGVIALPDPRPITRLRGQLERRLEEIHE